MQRVQIIGKTSDEEIRMKSLEKLGMKETRACKVSDEKPEMQNPKRKVWEAEVAAREAAYAPVTILWKSMQDYKTLRIAS